MILSVLHRVSVSLLFLAHLLFAFFFFIFIFLLFSVLHTLCFSLHFHFLSFSHLFQTIHLTLIRSPNNSANEFIVFFLAFVHSPGIVFCTILDELCRLNSIRFNALLVPTTTERKKASFLFILQRTIHRRYN